MSKKVINIGIIGLGAVGERLIKIFEGRDDIQSFAFCDTSRERLEKMAETYGVEATYTDFNELLANDKLDAVYVAVPPKYHEEVVLASIKAGKHILCEKPLANNVEEAKRMLLAINETDLICGMHFPLNYQASLQQFESLIKEGFIGDLRRINLKMHFPHWPRLWQQSDWVASREQGGYVLEVGVHWIQAIQRIFGKVTEVRSQLQFPDDPTLCENGIIAEMKLENGVSILIDGLSNVGGEEHLEFAAYGTEATLMLRNWRELLGARNGEPLEELTTSEDSPINLVTEFVKAVSGENAQLYDFSVGYNAQIVLEALRHPQKDSWQTLQY